MFDSAILARFTEPYERKDRIYFLMHGRTVVYVGRSSALDARLQAHRNSEKEFDAVRFMDASHCDAARLERALIRFFRPAYNGLHSTDHLTEEDKAILARNGISNELEEYSVGAPKVEAGENPQVVWAAHRISLAMQGHKPSHTDFLRFCLESA